MLPLNIYRSDANRCQYIQHSGSPGQCPAVGFGVAKVFLFAVVYGNLSSLQQSHRLKEI
jgi:hypothetical protein